MIKEKSNREIKVTDIDLYHSKYLFVKDWSIIGKINSIFPSIVKSNAA